MAKDKELEKYKRALGIALDALNMYADPESYHAAAFAFDRPCGCFADDFSRTTHPHYNRAMPGKRARQALRTLERKYGSLTFVEPSGAS